MQDPPAMRKTGRFTHLKQKNIRAYSNKTAPLHFPCRLFISHLSSYYVALFLVLQRVPMVFKLYHLFRGHFFFSAKKTDGAQKAVGVQRVPSWPCSSDQRNPTWTGWLNGLVRGRHQGWVGLFLVAPQKKTAQTKRVFVDYFC